MDYLIAKWLHILSSTLLFGTGIGSAWYMLTASLTRDPRVPACLRPGACSVHVQFLALSHDGGRSRGSRR